MPLLVLSKRLNAACASYFLYMQECMCFVLPIHARSMCFVSAYSDYIYMQECMCLVFSMHARMQVGSIRTDILCWNRIIYLDILHVHRSHDETNIKENSYFCTKKLAGSKRVSVCYSNSHWMQAHVWRVVESHFFPDYILSRQFNLQGCFNWIFCNEIKFVIKYFRAHLYTHARLLIFTNSDF